MDSNRETIQRIFDEPLILARLLGYDKVTTPQHRSWIIEPWLAGHDTLLLAHRNSYKTTCRVVSIIWGLLFWPETRVFVIRKSSDDAAKIVSEVMQHYERDALRGIYGLIGVQEPRDLDRWSEGKGIALSTKKNVTKERSLEYAGVGKPKTGAHYDLIFPDDIVTLEDRYYRVEREKTKIFVRELQNILTPQPLGIHFSGTPWHENDAWSEIEKTTSTKRFPVQMGFVKEMDEKRQAAIRRTITESEWAANYEMRHIADKDRIFQNPNFGDIPDDLAIYAYLDPAFTRDGDHSALCLAGKKGGKMYVVAGYIWQSEVSLLYDKVKALMETHEAIQLFCESNQAQVTLVTTFRGMGIRCQPVANTKNKHFRITQYALRNWAHIVFNENLRLSDFMRQVLDYQPGVTADDAPDALAGIAAVFLKGLTRGRSVQDVEY